MRAKDWKAVKTAKVLLIGEDSNLQWSDAVPEFVMFADYFFRKFPKDHGERSRNVEARNVFAQITDLTDGLITAEDVYITNLCNDSLEHAPKGKRVLIPEAKALKGIEHINWILSENPSIEWIFSMSLQTNYWLQKTEFCIGEDIFVKAAEPRRIGIECIQPYYQPVNGKAFSEICGNIYNVKNGAIKVIPILPAKDYPLKEQNIERYAGAYDKIRGYFREVVKSV